MDQPAAAPVAVPQPPPSAVAPVVLPPWRNQSSASSSTDNPPMVRDWWRPAVLDPVEAVDPVKEIERLLVSSLEKDREKEDMERAKRAKVDTATKDSEVKTVTNNEMMDEGLEA